MSTCDVDPFVVRWFTRPRFQAVAAVLSLCVILLSIYSFYVVRPYDGLFARPFPWDRVLVHTLYPGGPAEKAGVRLQDQILAIDGRPVDALSLMPMYRPGPATR